MKDNEPASFTTEIARLREKGWSCKWNEHQTDFPNEIVERYPWMPTEYIEFIQNLSECVNKDETLWILSPIDFDIRQDNAFHHDEWERISLEAIDDDENEKEKIKKFWDSHLPICFDVSDGYTHYSLKVDGKSGAVACGGEPEFEDVEIVAESFRGFLKNLK